MGNAAPLLANGYGSYQLNPNMWLGMSLNSLHSGFQKTSLMLGAGAITRPNGALLATYNAAPSFAFRINDWISVGTGAQIQYAKANVSFGLPDPSAKLVDLRGTGMGYGATAGVTLTPTPTTTIGLGWRSAINQKIDGELGLERSGATLHIWWQFNTTVKLPDIVSLGIRQRVDQRWTLMGTVEWTNWSRIGTLTVSQFSGSPISIGGQPHTVPFE